MDCNCLSQKITFIVYHKRPTKWYHMLDLFYSRYLSSTILTVHGETMKEIDTKVEVLQKEYAKEFKEPVTVYIHSS